MVRNLGLDIDLDIDFDIKHSEILEGDAPPCKAPTSTSETTLSQDQPPTQTQTLSKSWSQTTKDLKSALDTWENISKECEGPSPDEQMLKDMQDLLKKLQGKLEELS